MPTDQTLKNNDTFSKSIVTVVQSNQERHERGFIGWRCLWARSKACVRQIIESDTESGDGVWTAGHHPSTHLKKMNELNLDQLIAIWGGKTTISLPLSVNLILIQFLTKIQEQIKESRKRFYQRSATKQLHLETCHQCLHDGRMVNEKPNLLPLHKRNF